MLPSATTSNRAKGLGPVFWVNGRLTCPDATFRQLSQYLPTPGRVRLSEDPSSRPLVLHALSPDWEDAQHPSGPGATTSCRRSRQDEETRSAFHVQLQRQSNGDWVVHPARLLVATVLGDSASSGTLELLGRSGKLLLVEEGALGGASQAITASAAAPQRRRRRQQTSAAATAPRVHDLQQAQSAPRAGTAGPSARVPRTKPAAPPAGAATSPEAIPMDAAAAGEQPRQKQPEPDVGRGTFPADLLGAANDATAPVACAASCACAPLAGATSGSDAPSSERALAARSPAAGEQEAQQPRRDSGDVGHVGQAQQPKAVSAARATTASTSSAPSIAAAASTAHHIAAASSGGSAPKSDGSGGGQQQAASAEDTCSTEIGIHAQPHTEGDEDDLLRLDGQCCRAYNKKRLCALYPKWARTPLPGGTRHAYKALLLRVITPPELGFGPELEQTFPAFLHKERRSTGFIHLYLDSLWVVARELDWQGGALFTLDRELHPTTATAAATAAAAAAAGGYSDTTKHPEELVVRVAAVGTGQMDEKTARMVDTRQRAEEERTRRRLAVPRDYVVLRLTSSMLRQRSESLEFTAPAAAASWLGHGARWDVAGDGALLPVRWTESDDTAGGESADLQRTSITLSARHQGVSQQCVLRALHPQLHKAQAVPGDVLVLSPLWRSVEAAAVAATATDSIGPSRRCSSSGAVCSGGGSGGNADRAGKVGRGTVCGNVPATKAAAAVAGGAATAGVPACSGATAGPPAAAVHGQQQDQQSPAGLTNHPAHVRYVSAVKAHLRRCSEWDAGGVVRAQHDGISSAHRRRWLLSWTRTRTATAAACLAPAVTDAESAAGTSAGSAAASSGVTQTTGTPHTAAASSKSAGSPQRTTSASVQRRRLRCSSVSVQQPAPRAPQQPARPTASSPSKAPLHHPVAAGTAVDPAAAGPPAAEAPSSNEATAEPVGPAAATPAAATPGKESGEVDDQHHAAAAEGSKQQQEQVTTEPRQPLRAVQPQQAVLQPPRAPVSPLASRALSQQLTLSPGRLTPLRLLSPPTSPSSATGVFRAAAAKSPYGSASGAAWRPSAVPRALARFGAKLASAGVPKTPSAAPSTPNEPSSAAGAGAVPQPHQAVTTPHQNAAVICALPMTEASAAQAHFKFAAGNSTPLGASGGVISSLVQAVEPSDGECKGGSRSSADAPSQQPLPPVLGEPQQYQQQELRRRLLLARRSLHPLQLHAPDTAAVEGPSDAPLQSEAAGRIVSPPVLRPLPLMARRLLLKGWPPATSSVNAGPTAAAGDSASQAADTFLVAAAQDLVLTTASQQQPSFTFIGDEPLLRCELPAETQEDPCGLPRVAGSAAAGIDETGHQLPSPDGLASIHLLHGAVRPRSIIIEPRPMSPTVQKPAGVVLHSSDGVLQQEMAVKGSQLSTAARAEETRPPAAAPPSDLPSLQQPEAASESLLNQNQTGEDAFTREPEELGPRVQQQRARGTGDQQVEGQVAAAQQHIAPTEGAPEKPCHTLYTLRLKLSQKARLGSAKAAVADRRPLGSKRIAADAGCEEELQPQQKRQRGPTRWDPPLLQPQEQQQHQQQSNPLPFMTAVPEPVGSAVQRRPAPSAAAAPSLLTAPQLQQVTPQPLQPAVRDVQREPSSPPPSPPPARRHQLSDGGLEECQPAAQHLAAASSWGTLLPLPLTPSRCDPHPACAAAEPLQAVCEHSPAIPCKHLLRDLLAELSSTGPEMRRLCSGPAGDVVTERLQWLGMAAVIAAKELSKRGALQPQQLCGGKAVAMRFQNCPLPELLVQVWLPQLGSPAAAADVDWTQASALAACGQIVGAIKKASQQGDSAALARWFQALVVGDFNKICLDLLEEESGRNDSARRLVWASLLPEAMGPRYYCHVEILEAHS